MVCQRSRDRKGDQNKKANSSLPLKKRSAEHFAPLTKASLDSMLSGQTTTTLYDNARTVSIDDNRSIISSSNTSSAAAATGSQPSSAIVGRGVCTDEKVVKQALCRRDEEERLKVAKAMLYQSFLSALQGN